MLVLVHMARSDREVRNLHEVKALIRQYATRWHAGPEERWKTETDDDGSNTQGYWCYEAVVLSLVCDSCCLLVRW